MAALLGQQQHEPPAGAHIILLAGAAVAAVVLLGVRWRRNRRDAQRDEQETSHGRAAESTRETEEE